MRLEGLQPDTPRASVLIRELSSFTSFLRADIQPDEGFLKRLTDGYRMERPAYCPASVYELMGLCWQLGPEARPEFEEIVAEVEQLIDQSEGSLYVGLVNDD